MIIEIDFNWFYSVENGSECESFAVGKRGVVSILDTSDHPILCYTVYFEDGKSQDIYNPNKIYRSPKVLE